MAITAAQKVRSILLNALSLRGWAPVGNDDSGVYYKNSVYLVTTKGKEAIPMSFAEGDMIAGIYNTVHNTDDSWWLMHDGFLIESGRLPSRTLSQYYPWSEECANSPKINEFIDELDAIASLDDDEIKGRVKKETRIRLGLQQTGSRYVRSNRGVAETKLFVCDTVSFPSLQERFRSGEVYKIFAFVDGNFRIVNVNDDPDGDDTIIYQVTAEQLEKLITKMAFLAVEDEAVSDEDITYVYEPMFTGNSVELPADFGKLNLSVTQRRFVKTALAEGLNFTPFVQGGLGTQELDAILYLLRKGADCECLLGKNLKIEQLEFLKGLADNGFPMEGFCIPDASEEFLNDKYSNVLASIDSKISVDYGSFPEEVKKFGRQVAFYFRGCDHVFVDEPLMKIKLLDLIQRCEDLKPLCELFFKRCAFDDEKRCKIYWSSLENDEKMKILKFFMDERFLADGKSFNEFLVKSINKFTMFNYTAGGKFTLLTDEICITFDYNSVYVLDSRGCVLWRGTLINDEAINYTSDLFLAYL